MRLYAAPVLSFLLAVFALLGNTRDASGLTPLGWATAALVTLALGATLATIARQSRRVRLHEVTWARSLGDGVEHHLAVLRYLDFAARQFAVQAERLGTTCLTGTSADFALGMPNGWGEGHGPPDALSSEAAVAHLAAYRVDPPRGIGGPWAASVPFGTDPRLLPEIVSEETAAGIDQLVRIHHLYGAQLGGRLTALLGQALEAAYPRYLLGLPELCATRAADAGTRWPDVRLVGSRGAPPVEEYLAWCRTLDGLLDVVRHADAAPTGSPEPAPEPAPTTAAGLAALRAMLAGAWARAPLPLRRGGEHP